jgi:cell shape-determining protein MreC
MDKKSGRNIAGLLQSAGDKKRETEEKVDKAIESLKRSKTKKINFRTVSKTSGVSTTTLYNNPKVRERISSLRAVENYSINDKVDHAENVQENQRLKQEIQRLKEEKKMLILQLVELEQLKIENSQLKAILSRVKRE